MVFRVKTVILAATNDKDAIDSAILSRFTEHRYIPLPNKSGRLELLRVHLSNARASFEVHELEMLATQSEGMSGRDIKNWIIKAQKHAAHLAVEGEARQRMS
jgi:AAA+ superfamily predicted ATPase